MKTTIFAIWFDYMIVQGHMEPGEKLPEQLIQLESNCDITDHLLKYHDGRDHILINDYVKAMDKLQDDFKPIEQTRPGKWILFKDNWIRKDNDPFLRGDTMIRSDKMDIPRVPFLPWHPDLSNKENRLREAAVLLRTLKDCDTYLEIPSTAVELKNHMIHIIENGGKIPPKIAVLVDNILSESNKGDYFRGPIGDLKVLEDKHNVASAKMKIVKYIGEEAFKLERARPSKGQRVDYGLIGKVAHDRALLLIKTGDTGLTW